MSVPAELAHVVLLQSEWNAAQLAIATERGKGGIATLFCRNCAMLHSGNPSGFPGICAGRVHHE